MLFRKEGKFKRKEMENLVEEMKFISPVLHLRRAIFSFFGINVEYHVQNKTMQMMYETIYKALVEVGLEDAFTPLDYLNFFCLGKREVAGRDNSFVENSAPANTPQVSFSVFPKQHIV